MNKALSQKLHCLKRLRQRFKKTEDDYKDILEAIWSGKAEHIYKQSNTRTIFRVKDLYAVYDKTRKTVVTVMTQEMMQ